VTEPHIAKCHSCSRASEFGYDGGPAAKSLELNFNLFLKKVFTYTGMAVPHVQVWITFL
jgi:hypothetical protein